MFWPIPFLSPVLHHITLNIKIYINIKKKKKKKKKKDVAIYTNTIE